MEGKKASYLDHFSVLCLGLGPCPALCLCFSLCLCFFLLWTRHKLHALCGLSPFAGVFAETLH